MTSGETKEKNKDPSIKEHSSLRITSFQHPNESINEFGASKSKYLRSVSSSSSTANSSRFVHLKIGRNVFDCRRDL